MEKVVQILRVFNGLSLLIYRANCLYSQILDAQREFHKIYYPT